MEHFVDVAGGRLLVVDEGAGPPVVLLHAGIVDLRSWDALVPHLVRAGWRAVRYDARGWGRSVTDDVAFSNRADLVAVLDALGGFEAPATAEELALFAEMERLEEAEPKDAEAIIALATRVWADGPGQPAGRAPAWIAEQVRATNLLLSEPGHVLGRPIVLDPPAATRLAELRCPVLAVAGALDVSDVAATARHLADHAPDARVVVLPDVAHMIGMERPAELAALVADFLGPLRPWA